MGSLKKGKGVPGRRPLSEGVSAEAALLLV